MIVNEEAVKEILAQVKGAKLVAATKYVDYHEIEDRAEEAYKAAASKGGLFYEYICG